MSDFEIKILRQYWISDDGKYDDQDLCSHGEVYVRIGDDVLSDKDEGWTLSATALCLLRTLDHNYKAGDYSGQLLPCCGNFLVPDEDGDNRVDIIGCPHGIDWQIEHEYGNVILISDKGSKAELPFDEYKKLVLNFVDEVEAFYQPERKIIKDEFDLSGFNCFWQEWRERKKRHL